MTLEQNILGSKHLLQFHPLLIQQQLFNKTLRDLIFNYLFRSLPICSSFPPSYISHRSPIYRTHSCITVPLSGEISKTDV